MNNTLLSHGVWIVELVGLVEITGEIDSASGSDYNPQTTSLQHAGLDVWRNQFDNTAHN